MLLWERQDCVSQPISEIHYIGNVEKKVDFVPKYDYVEVTLLAADQDCLNLYEEGAKGCVSLLKKLGVL